MATLAAAGDGEALYLSAIAKAKSDKTEAKRLFLLSAQAGYPDLVKRYPNANDLQRDLDKWAER